MKNYCLFGFDEEIPGRQQVLAQAPRQYEVLWALRAGFSWENLAWFNLGALLKFSEISGGNNHLG